MIHLEVRSCCFACWVGLGASVLFSGCTTAPDDIPVTVESPDAGDPGLDLPTGSEIEVAANEAVGAVAERATAAWERASSAMKDFEGGHEMLASAKDMYSSAKTAVEDVTSEEAAKKAKAELDQLSVKIEAWKPKLAEMSEDAKVAAKRFFDHVAERLKSFAEQLEENEWVQNTVKPKLDEIVEQLKSLVAES